MSRVKSVFAGLLLGLALGGMYSPVHADNCTLVLPPMPTSSQYPSMEQYQAALNAWRVMARKIIEQGNPVQPPPMPRPYQYRHHQHYMDALKTWQSLFE